MSLCTWLASSLARIYPRTTPGRSPAPTLDIARNERCSFQLGLRLETPLETMADTKPVEVAVACTAPAGWQVRIRRVGFVPVRHLNTCTQAAEIEGTDAIPGFVPDPLFDETAMLLPANQTNAFWFTVVPGPKTAPGNYALTVQVTPATGRPRKLTARIRVHAAMIRPRTGFRVTHWFYNDALMDFYGCQGFDERFWNILPAYLKNVVSHGQDTLYVPVFTPSLDGVKRPSQLLRVTPKAGGGWSFDWRDVKRYTDLARGLGFTHFEWSHFFTQWGVFNAIRIYEGQGLDEKLLWPADTAATGPEYRKFLEAFLPEFHAFLQAENLLGCSFFHVSDEPHGEKHLENYRQARALLKELAPWMRVMDALTDIRFAKDGLTDMPVPSISTAVDFVNEGIPCWCYYCCGERGAFLNRLLDTPLAKIRMNGWLFYRWPFQGFLHWGYNYWYKRQTRTMLDPFTEHDGLGWPGWATGDPYMVYPGPDGPIDSLRWEIFAESLQDYALLQSLGVERQDAILAPLKSFQDFPKTAAWLRKTKRALLGRASA